MATEVTVPQGVVATHLAMSPDGRLVAFAGGYDKSIHVWDLWEARELTRFVGHEGFVTNVAFAQDGRSIFSASQDATALRWPLEGRIAATPPAAPPSPEQLVRAVGALGGDDVRAAIDAQRLLIRAGDAAMDALDKSLQPIRVDRPAVARWIEQLDADSYKDRDAAAQRLRALGPFAAPRLREAIKTAKSLEMQVQIDNLLKALGDDPNTPSALPTVELSGLRAVSVLGAVASRRAEALLKRLAEGDDSAHTTRLASQALARRQSGRGTR